jgi:hypothetical protein
MVEKHRLRVFENSVLRGLFGPKREEVTVEWRRLHKEELYALYSSPNIIRVIMSRRMKWAERVARMGERRGAYRALVGSPKVRRRFYRTRRKRGDNIKTYFQDAGLWVGMDWIRLAQDRNRVVVNAVMNLMVPLNAGNFLSS